MRTVVVLRASCPEESRTTIEMVYVPVALYECVNVVVCTNVSRAAKVAMGAGAITSSPHVIEYVSWPFSGSLACIVHVPI